VSTLAALFVGTFAAYVLFFAVLNGALYFVKHDPCAPVLDPVTAVTCDYGARPWFWSSR